MYMKLDVKMSKYVTEMYLEFKKWIHTDGCIYTLLEKVRLIGFNKYQPCGDGVSFIALL